MACGRQFRINEFTCCAIGLWARATIFPSWIQILSIGALLASVWIIIEEGRRIARKFTPPSFVIKNGRTITSNTTWHLIIELIVAIDATKWTALTTLSCVWIGLVWRTLSASFSFKIVGLPRCTCWPAELPWGIKDISEVASGTLNSVGSSISETSWAKFGAFITLSCCWVHNSSSRACSALPCFKIEVMIRVSTLRAAIFLSKINYFTNFFTRCALWLITSPGR